MHGNLAFNLIMELTWLYCILPHRLKQVYILGRYNFSLKMRTYCKPSLFLFSRKNRIAFQNKYFHMYTVQNLKSNLYILYKCVNWNVLWFPERTLEMQLMTRYQKTEKNFLCICSQPQWHLVELYYLFKARLSHIEKI